MKKEELRQQLINAGDAVITYRSVQSNKTKYNICTLDFSTPYIQEKNNRAKETDDTLLMFCWDTDGYRLMKADRVKSVTPLSKLLRNDPDV